MAMNSRRRSCPSFAAIPGRLFGFGETDARKLDQLRGRFANLLPPEPVDDEMSLMARRFCRPGDQSEEFEAKVWEELRAMGLRLPRPEGKDARVKNAIRLAHKNGAQ